MVEKGQGSFEGHNLLEDVLSWETSEVSGFEEGSFHRDPDFKQDSISICSLSLVDIIRKECSFERFKAILVRLAACFISKSHELAYS
jgi:hypothetical protein